jgi:hypothetical protein
VLGVMETGEFFICRNNGRIRMCLAWVISKDDEKSSISASVEKKGRAPWCHLCLV